MTHIPSSNLCQPSWGGKHSQIWRKYEASIEGQYQFGLLLTWNAKLWEPESFHTASSALCIPFTGNNNNDDCGELSLLFRVHHDLRWVTLQASFMSSTPRAKMWRKDEEKLETADESLKMCRAQKNKLFTLQLIFSTNQWTSGELRVKTACLPWRAVWIHRLSSSD